MVSCAEMRGVLPRAICVAVLFAASIGMTAVGGAPFPDARPTTRADAASLLCPGAEAIGACVRARLTEIGGGQPIAPPAIRRSTALLARGIALAEERTFGGPDDLRIRFTTAAMAFDRTDATDGSDNGVPDVVEAVALGAWQARGLLLRQFELPRPSVTEILLVELGDRIDGYALPTGGGALSLVLDGTPSDGAEGARRAAIRMYAYAVARGSGPGVPAPWAEAIAMWAALSIDGAPDLPTARALSLRTRTLESGLDVQDPAIAAGNALWLAFLEEAYGLGAVRATIEELGRSLPVEAALDRAVRRSSRGDLFAALRDFHLWCVMAGDRADLHHFPFASVLDTPIFATRTEGLPAIAIREAQAVSPLGASHALLVPGESEGGLHVRFEGDFLATWEADLLLVAENGAPRRVPFALGPEGRGELTVPLRGIRDAVLLVRNLASVDGAAHRYSLTAFHEPRFPFDLVTLDARSVDGRSGGVLVAWETASEHALVGFNVVRVEADGGSEVVVNPAWIPAMGGRAEPAAYRFLDRSTDPLRAYSYRIEGLTTDGIASSSPPVLVPRSTR